MIFSFLRTGGSGCRKSPIRALSRDRAFVWNGKKMEKAGREQPVKLSGRGSLFFHFQDANFSDLSQQTLASPICSPEPRLCTVCIASRAFLLHTQIHAQSSLVSSCKHPRLSLHTPSRYDGILFSRTSRFLCRDSSSYKSYKDTEKYRELSLVFPVSFPRRGCIV